MKNGISLRLPADMGNFDIIRATLQHLGKKIGFAKNDLNDLVDATRELVENAVTHAYPDQDGLLEISMHSFEHGMRLDVRDWGIPMSKKDTLILPINHKSDRGFDHIYALVDSFYYKNLGKGGKKFTIIKRTSLPLDVCQNCSKASKKPIDKNLKVTIRDFRRGDEESIARLIYRNYGLSYAKAIFYYPRKILSGEGKEFASIIAQIEGKIVGHFALLLMPTSNIAEIGVVVVDPRYKGMGIMNKMFKRLLQKAGELKLSAVYGEAVMYHIFSQKSNLTHHFCESALVIGKTPREERIENNKLTERARRGSDLIAYRFFEKRARVLYLPERYKDQILQSYRNCKIPYEAHRPDKEKAARHARLSYHYNPVANIGKIMIHRYGKDFKYKFILLLEQLRAKHCDMIYADINLEAIPQMEKVIKLLNGRLFFYSGVLFLKYHDQDYLRLQNRHSEMIGKKNMVCYSDYCHTLLEYIHQDENEVKKSLRKSKPLIKGSNKLPKEIKYAHTQR